MYINMRDIKRLLILIFLIFLIAVALNFVWEFLHHQLYICSIPATECAWRDALIDALIILGIFFAGIILFKDTSWNSRLTKKKIFIVALASFIIAYIIELQGIYLGKWEYTELMPVIPLLNVGLSPILQMIVLPLLTFFIVGKVTNTGKRFIPAAGFHIFTPFFDFICSFIGLGKAYRKKVLERVKVPNKKLRVLDAGCGTGSLAIELKKLKPKLELYAIDIDDGILSIAREKAKKQKLKINFKKAFIQKLPFPDKYFDFVYSSLVIHHLKAKDKELALEEICRITKKGGSFLLADFGKPRNALSSVFSFFSIVFEQGYENYKGKLPDMLLNAKFKKVEKTGQYRYNIHFLLTRK